MPIEVSASDLIDPEPVEIASPCRTMVMCGRSDFPRRAVVCGSMATIPRTLTLVVGGLSLPHTPASGTAAVTAKINAVNIRRP